MMEKSVVGAAKSKIKLLMFLPKPASAHVGLQNQNQYPFSPRKMIANRLKSHQSKGFSGPITSVVFEEARNKANGSSSRFDAKEPTSPKISCMGQIKCRKKKKKMMMSKNENKIDGCSNPLLDKQVIVNPKKKAFSKAAKQGRKSAAASTAEKSSKLPDRAPSLSQMKRFASSRDSFSRFDYNKVQVAPDSGESSDEGEVIIPFSAPILRAEIEAEPAPITLQPRTEINLWKRRTMAQPKPLLLNPLVV